MSFTIPTVPQEAVAALTAALRQLTISPMVAARLPHATAAIRRFTTGPGSNPATSTTISLPFFVLDFSDVSKGITAARQVGWRHLLPTGDSAGPAMADTLGSASQHAFAGLTESPFAGVLERQLAALGQAPTIAAGSYNVALLQVPACNVMAIWLEDTAHNNDLVVPVAPTPPSLTAGQQYSTSQFLGALRQAS